jgi:glycosyltransferase 2 family protein
MPNTQPTNKLSASPPVLSRRTRIIRWAGTLLAVALLVYLLSREGWADIALALRQISIWRFLLCLFFMLLSRLAVAIRWHLLLRSAQANITVSQTLKVTFAGLFASNFLPTTIGGDVVRLGGIIHLGLEQTLSLASLIVDRLVGMAGMASALPLGIPALISYHPDSGAGLLVSSPLILTQTAQSKRWRDRLLDRSRSALGHLSSALSIWLKRPGSLFTAFVFTWVHQLSMYAQMWLLLRSMGESLPIWSIAGLWAATYFTTLLPVSVNGLGMQELSATFFFTSVGGVSLENSLTMAMLVRLLQALASLPGALFIPNMLSGKANPDSKVITP